MNKIAIVETQKRTREHIDTLLSRKGYTTILFENADDFLRELEASKTDIELLIAAWFLVGETSGPELLMRLKQRKVFFPVIVIASFVGLDISNQVFDLGGADLLLKPIDGDRLCKAVGKALHDPKEVDPLVAELRKELIGSNPSFLDAIVKLAKAIESKDTNVLLVGESGVGKEIFAQLIHKHSEYKEDIGQRIVDTNITSIPETLIESVLFGHEKGAFTGANNRHIGLFELAGDGVLFLDEIGDLAPSCQPKLLRAIEERHFYRVGGNEEIPFRARLVCATSRNLAQATLDGTFRNDLYYRINELEIRIPPLRERKEDIRNLTLHFLGDSGFHLEREALALLESYSFPGNVRDLQNVLTQAKAACSDKTILPNHLPHKVMSERESKPLDRLDQSIRSTREDQYSWLEFLFDLKHDDAVDEIIRYFDTIYLPKRIREAGTQEKAAKVMGTTPKTLRQWLKNCGLDKATRKQKGRQ